MKKVLRLGALAASLATSACTTLGHFGPLMDSRTPDVSSVASHIQCEIYRVMIPDAEHPPIDNYRLLTDNRYVAYAQLTLDVTSNEALTPNLGFITPYTKPMTSLTVSVGGQLGGTQHKTITQSFTIVLDPSKISPAEAAEYCGGKDGRRGGLGGDLGLDNIIEAGLYHATEEQFLFPLPRADDTATTGTKISPMTEPVFGSTIDFTIVYGLAGTGPTWVLTHFKGPGGGNAGLLNATRTVKDTLVISFAPSRPEGVQGIRHPPGAAAPQGAKRPPRSASELSNLPKNDAAAAAAAKDNTGRMILQNALPQVPQ